MFASQLHISSSVHGVVALDTWTISSCKHFCIVWFRGCSAEGFAYGLFSRSSRGGGSKYKLCTLSLILLLSNSCLRTRVSLDADVINVFRNRSYYIIQKNCRVINLIRKRARAFFLHDFPLEARRRWISCPLVALPLPCNARFCLRMQAQAGDNHEIHKRNY